MELFHLSLPNAPEDGIAGALAVPTDVFSTTVVYNLIAIAIVFIIWVVKSEKRGDRYNVRIKLTRDVGVNTCVGQDQEIADKAAAEEEDALVQEIISDLHNLSLKLEEELDGSKTGKLMEERFSVKEKTVEVKDNVKNELTDDRESEGMTEQIVAREAILDKLEEEFTAKDDNTANLKSLEDAVNDLVKEAPTIDKNHHICQAGKGEENVTAKKRRSRLPIRRKTISVDLVGTRVYHPRDFPNPPITTKQQQQQLKVQQTQKTPKYLTPPKITAQQQKSKRGRFYSERDVYCQACLHNDVILYSPADEDKPKIRRSPAVMKPVRTNNTKPNVRQVSAAIKKNMKTSIDSDNKSIKRTMKTSADSDNKSIKRNMKTSADSDNKSIKKNMKSIVDKNSITPNKKTGNFVSHPRGIYPATNRKLVKINYIKKA